MVYKIRENPQICHFTYRMWGTLGHSGYKTMRKSFIVLCCLMLSTSHVNSEKVCTSNGKNDFVDYGNIRDYIGCTKIKGNIRIVSATFDGDPYYNYPGLHPDSFEVFSSVRAITGHLLVQGSHQDFKSLAYFRNLEIIEGQELTQNTSLQVLHTSLESLDLRSLREVSAGNIVIGMNKNLCYADTVNYSRLLTGSNQRVVVKRNKSVSQCVLNDQVCSWRCDDNGCWGGGIKNCVTNPKESNEVESMLLDIL